MFLFLRSHTTESQHWFQGNLQHCPDLNIYKSLLPFLRVPPSICPYFLLEHSPVAKLTYIQEKPLVYSLHPSPYTLFPSPFSLLPTAYSLLPSPYSLLSTHYSLLPSPYTLHSFPYSLHHTPCSQKPSALPHYIKTHLSVIISLVKLI